MKEYLKDLEKWFFRFSSIFVVIILLCTIKLNYYIYMPGNLTDISNEVVLENEGNELNGSVSSVYVLSITRPTIFQYMIAKNLKYACLDQMTIEEAKQIDTKLDTAIGNFDSDRSFSQAELAAYSILHEGEEFYKEITYIYSAQSTIKSSTHKYTNLVGQMITGFGDTDDIYPSVEEVSNYLKNNESAKLYLESNSGNKTECYIEKKDDGYYGITLMKSFVLTVDKFSEVKNVYTQGPSGGAMQALYIYLKLIDEDLLIGRKIAGTGTITYSLNSEGEVVSLRKVGAIGCVEQKLYGAYLDKASVFYCPKSNYEDCMKAYELYGFKESDIRVVEVDTLDDILNDLRGTK